MKLGSLESSIGIDQFKPVLHIYGLDHQIFQTVRCKGTKCPGIGQFLKAPKLRAGKFHGRHLSMQPNVLGAIIHYSQMPRSQMSRRKMSEPTNVECQMSECGLVEVKNLE